MLRRALVLAFLTIPAAAAHATAPMNPGGWGQLTGPGFCWGLTSQSVQPPPGCAPAPALVGLSGAAVTPDGAQLIVAGGTDEFTFYGHGDGYGGVSVFSRDPATGALTPLECFSTDGSDAAGNAGCTPATALNRADAVAISPDGATVVVAASGAGSLTFFSRDTQTGKLTEEQCLQQNVPLGGACRATRMLDGVSALAFTPDGRDLIALTEPHDALVDVRRADDGTLTSGCFSRTGTSGSCSRSSRLSGPDAVAISADGRQVYVRTTVGIVWFTRSSDTGELAPGGCVDPNRAGGECTTATSGAYSYQYAYGPTVTAGHGVVLSPDGHQLYAGLLDDLWALTRADDGSLRPADCYTQRPVPSDDTSGDETTDDGTTDDDSATARAAQATCTQIDALGRSGALAITPDGSLLVSAGSPAVSLLHRDPTGALTDAGCLAFDDGRCGPLPTVGAPTELAVSPDSKQIYGVSGSVVGAFGPAPVLSRAADGTAIVRCAVACSGTARAVTLGHGLRAGAVASGAARAFRLGAGGRARIRVPIARHGGRVVLVATPRQGMGLAEATLELGRRGPASRGRYCLRRGCRFLGGTIVAPQARAGRFAAFAVRSRVRRAVWHTAVAVVDMAHRRVVFLAAAQGRGRGIAVPRLVLKPDGAVAWLACGGAGRRCRREHADEIHVRDALGARILSSAPGNIGDVLALRGSTLTYEVAGTLLQLSLR